MDKENIQSKKFTNRKAIVFIDGLCLICNTLVSLLLKIDRKGVLAFSNLQSITYLKAFGAKPLLETVVILEEDRVYEKSDAILRLFYIIGGVYKLLYIFILIPRPIRDFIYNIIAKNRYKIGKKYEVCPLIPKDVKERFLE